MKTKTFFATLGLAVTSMAALATPGTASADDYYTNQYYTSDYSYQSTVANYGTSNAYTWTTNTTTTSSTTSYVSSSDNLYPVGQCTWGAKTLAPWAGNDWGNGGDWAASAAADGFATGYTPQVGALIVWTDGGYGHVAYVTDVAADGQIQVMEANYNGNQAIGNYRGWFNPQASTTPGVVTYIYPNA